MRHKVSEAFTPFHALMQELASMTKRDCESRKLPDHHFSEHRWNEAGQAPRSRPTGSTSPLL